MDKVFVEVKISADDWADAYSYVEGYSHEVERYISNELLKRSGDGYLLAYQHLEEIFSDVLSGPFVALVLVNEAMKEVQSIEKDRQAEGAYQDMLDHEQLLREDSKAAISNYYEGE